MATSTFAVHIQKDKKITDNISDYTKKLAEMLEGSGIEIEQGGGIHTMSLSNCCDNASECTCHTDD